jgi:hypothetical protein
MLKILKSMIRDPDARAESIFWVGTLLILLTALVLMLSNGTYTQ